MFDLKQLHNQKFYAGSVKSGFDQTRGWFLGDFMPVDHPLKTSQIEAKYARHAKGELAPKHYHTQKIELLFILQGKARYHINDTDVELNPGDFLFVDINNVISGEFLADTELIAIHTPCMVGEKIDVE